MYQEPASCQRQGSRKPVILGSRGGRRTGAGSFLQVFSSGSTLVARHCVSKKLWVPSRRVACSAVTLFTAVYKTVAVLPSFTALPEKQPCWSGPSGVGASATGKCFQCSMSGLTACAQCISPHTAAPGLY